ncbi:MAG: M3 family metallopeptidase [Candidatus Cloacimonas sp.]|jgi:Zn-dependent oligopeptidase|nr:M3 family metallopeptidase [Candidatus Cloacimonas sp.]
MEQQNPLLIRSNDHRLKAIPFPQFKTEHYVPAIEVSLAEARAEIEAMKSNPAAPTFENTVLELDMNGELLDYVSTIYFNLLGAESDAEHKALAQQISPLLAEFSSEISTDPLIFKRVKAVYDAEVAGKPKPTVCGDCTDKELIKKAERYRLIERTYTGFIRGGAMLNDADKKRLTEISMESSQLSPKFSDNVLDATNKWELHLTDAKDVEGIPENSLKAAAFTARKKGKEEGWLFTLQPSSITPVLTYCKNREIRKQVGLAYTSRAFKDEFDNQELIIQTLKLRKERAALLGYDTHADYVLSDRMAESLPTAKEFLEKIYAVAYPAALKEVEEVRELARQMDGIEDMMQWDLGYYSNKLKEQRYAYDPEELRPWFKVENVVEGLFVVASKIYGIKVKQVHDVPVYHADVTTWEIHDKDGTYLGLMYMDLFPRDTKRGGAWQTSFQGQGLHRNGLRRPMVSIVASLTPSTDEQPSLLTLNEARTVFHEFGHALHSILADGYYKGLSGTSVLWDFVELPSQIMENWLMEEEALNLFAKHYKTGEALPKELLDKVIAAKNFQAGIANINQLRYALMDFAWHTAAPETIVDVDAFEKEVTERFRLLPLVKGTNISCAFSHIFAGGYSAGYYSYKWAEALEADAWSLFEEKGIFNAEVAGAFRKYVLARGNAFHPMDLFTAFRGRKPDPDALLKRDGLIG